MSLQQQIKDILIDLAVDDKLPLDLTTLDESVFDPVINPVTEILLTLRTDAEMALNDEWDCTTEEGKEGFEAQIELIDYVLNI